MSNTINVSPQMYKAIKNAREAAEYFAEQVQKYDDLLSKTDELQANIDKLESDYKEKKRIADLDLELMIKKDSEKAMRNIAGNLKYQVLTEEEHTKLVNQAADNTEELNKKLEEQQAKCERKLKAAVASAKQAAELEKAQIEANLTVSQQKIAFLEQQLKDTREEAAQARNTAERMVQHATSSRIEVNNGNSK